MPIRFIIRSHFVGQPPENRMPAEIRIFPSAFRCRRGWLHHLNLCWFGLWPPLSSTCHSVFLWLLWEPGSTCRSRRVWGEMTRNTVFFLFQCLYPSFSFNDLHLWAWRIKSFSGFHPQKLVLFKRNMSNKFLNHRFSNLHRVHGSIYIYSLGHYSTCQSRVASGYGW